MDFFRDIFPYVAVGIVGILVVYGIFSKGQKDK